MRRAHLLILVLLFGASLAGAQVLTQHDYDPVSDAVVNWRIPPGAAAGQSFRIGRGRIGGFRVKLQRWGEPLPLEYCLGTSPGAQDIAGGTFPLRRVDPWFERWVEVRLPAPVRPPAGTLYLQLRLPRQSTGAYEWYGTANAAVARPEFRVRFQYGDNAFENFANLDYGVRTPTYADGAAFDSSGAEIPALDFAFQIEGEKPVADGEEERFAFLEDITGPVYTHSLRRPPRRAAAGEITIDSGWKLDNQAHGIAAGNAAAEFLEFMRTAMETPLKGTGPERIKVAVGCGEPPRKAEGFELRVDAGAVQVCGYDDRGAMRGLHYLEAEMKMRHGPLLPDGAARKAPLWSPRITSAPFYSRFEYEAPVDQYTPGLLARMARAGFNAIWVWGDLDEIAHSSVYPELDQGVARRQQRLNNLISRAARYGIDVYLQLANRALPESFFARHPEARGSALPVFGPGYVLCTSVPEVREHLRAAMRNLAVSVPGLKGVIFIAGGEGFLHCYTRTNTCPRCSRRTPQETIAEFSTALLEGMRSGNPAAAVAIWCYSASNSWSKDDPTQSGLIAKLPPGMKWLTEFAKEGAVTFGGKTIPAYDYPISIVGPSDRFGKQSQMARERGLGFWVKTEHAIALEFVDVPYIPVFFQWAERFRGIAASPASAVFANWMHYGFMPTRATDLFYWSMWDHAGSGETILRRMAVRDFGEAASGHVLQAWRLFSQGIREYPFSGPMAMGPVQKGPAHPLFFDSGYRPRHARGRQFRNDLSWTQPWGPELAVAQMEKLAGLWVQGIAQLQEAAHLARGAGRQQAQRELGVASALLAAIRSTVHVGRFYMLRAELAAEPERPRRRELLDSMVKIAQGEIENARRALPFVRADSRLGYANSGRGDQEGVPRAGVYSPGSIEKKIAQVERMMRDEIPAYRRANGLE